MTVGFHRMAEGSVLYRAGSTVVLATASVDEKVPAWMEGKGKGWVTAEYQMHPRSNPDRREGRDGRGKAPSGRTQEIQRLVGRALRAAVDMKKLGERQITIDCDVLEADGGTRTASITGAFVALHDALRLLQDRGQLQAWPLRDFVAAVSVGVYQGAPVLDLDYAEDSACETDMNIVMTGSGGIVELQGTAEGQPFTRAELDAMVDLGRAGIAQLVGTPSRRRCRVRASIAPTCPPARSCRCGRCGARRSGSRSASSRNRSRSAEGSLQREQRALGDHLRIRVALHERLAARLQLAERIEFGADAPIARDTAFGDALAQKQAGRLEQRGDRGSRVAARAAKLLGPVEQRRHRRRAEIGDASRLRTHVVRRIGEARLGTRERDPLAARAHRGEQPGCGGRDEQQRGTRRRFFEQSQQRVLRLVVELLGVGDHRGAMAAAVRAQSQRLLQCADLSDAHARVVGTALDPEQVRVIADVAEQRPRFAGAVERDHFALRGSPAARARLAGPVGRGFADQTARKAQRLVARDVGRSGEQIRRVDASRLETAAQERFGTGNCNGHRLASLEEAFWLRRCDAHLDATLAALTQVRCTSGRCTRIQQTR